MEKKRKNKDDCVKRCERRDSAVFCFYDYNNYKDYYSKTLEITVFLRF